MIKIQHHCTPKQARQLYDAVTAAGLTLPDIDWAFYVRIDTKPPTIWERNTKNYFYKIAWKEHPDIVFIPCPTLAELIYISRFASPFTIGNYLDSIIETLELDPEGLVECWEIKLQEEAQ